MFRQVIAYRWAKGVDEDAKAAFRKSLGGLAVIPELSSLQMADDARHFEGNFDAVAVMDFPDFAAARRYVADERHQAYIRDFASTMIGERVVVQHDWATGDLAGVHHVTLPVSDLARSRDWYALAFGLEVVGEDTDGNAAEIVMQHPASAITVVLRHDPDRARALAGFSPITFTAGTVDDLQSVLAGLDARGITHGEPTASTTAVTADVVDPDGLVVRLSTLLA